MVTDFSGLLLPQIPGAMANFACDLYGFDAKSLVFYPKVVLSNDYPTSDPQKLEEFSRCGCKPFQ